MRYEEGYGREMIKVSGGTRDERSPGTACSHWAVELKGKEQILEKHAHHLLALSFQTGSPSPSKFAHSKKLHPSFPGTFPA